MNASSVRGQGEDSDQAKQSREKFPAKTHVEGWRE